MNEESCENGMNWNTEFVEEHNSFCGGTYITRTPCCKYVHFSLILSPAILYLRKQLLDPY